MSGFNIDEFKGNVGVGGFVQTNKYEVSIFPGKFRPTLNSAGIQASTIDMVEDLKYRCVSASLPGMAIRTMDVNRYGLGVLEKMPFTANFTDTSLTFICDRYGLTYNYWYGWLNYIFAANGKDSGTAAMGTNRTHYTTEYKDNYSSVIEIKVFDNGGDPVLNYALFKAFPISINDTPISWGDNNNLLKVTVTLSFREWSYTDLSIVNQNVVF